MRIDMIECLKSPNPPLQLGSIVNPWGKVAAVVLTGGERYYMLIRDNNSVSFLPWQVVENVN